MIDHGYQGNNKIRLNTRVNGFFLRVMSFITIRFGGKLISCYWFTKYYRGDNINEVV